MREGGAHATQASDNWLRELASRDFMPELMSHKWQLVTVAALVRAVTAQPPSPHTRDGLRRCEPPAAAGVLRQPGLLLLAGP